jgi:hypothetical protein
MPVKIRGASRLMRQDAPGMRRIGPGTGFVLEGRDEYAERGGCLKVILSINRYFLKIIYTGAEKRLAQSRMVSSASRDR